MQKEQYECGKSKLSHWRVLCVFKELERFATQNLNENSLKVVEVCTLTFIELIMLPVKKNKTLQLSVMFNKKKTFTGKDENKVYFNNTLIGLSLLFALLKGNPSTLF